MKEIKKPILKNEENMKYCFSLGMMAYYDETIANYTKKEVLDLCIDLDKHYEYLAKVIRKTPLVFTSVHDNGKNQIEDRENMEIQVTAMCSFVWSALFNFHDEIIPQKYKPTDEDLK